MAFTHASSYAIVIDTKPMNEKEEIDEIPEAEMSDNDEDNSISTNKFFQFLEKLIREILI